MSSAKQPAGDSLKNQQAFRLGALTTEPAHPKTTTLSILAAIAAGGTALLILT